MSTPTREVARAIQIARYGQLPDDAIQSLFDNAPKVREEALAAIKALADNVSDEMIDAGNKASASCDQGYHERSRVGIAAAIRAALLPAGDETRAATARAEALEERKNEANWCMRRAENLRVTAESATDPMEASRTHARAIEANHIAAMIRLGLAARSLTAPAVEKE